MNPFTREELIDIRQKATKLCENDTDPFWIEAYFELAMAADRLDAMIARTNVIGTQGPPIELNNRPEIK
jgi:hypothetical protein